MTKHPRRVLEPALWIGLAAASLLLRVLAWQERAENGSFRSMLDTSVYRRIAESIASGHTVGEQAFFMSPAYPYLMAWWGDAWLILVQIVAGVSGLLLLGMALRSRLGAVAGLSSLALGGLAAPMILYDTSLLPDGLATASLCLALAVLLRSPRAGWRSLLGAGFAMALGISLRSNLLLVVILWILAFAWRARSRERRSAVRELACLAAPVLLMALTLSLANHRAEGLWAPRSYNGGVNLYLGNAPTSEGTYTTINEVHPGDPMGRAAAERVLGRGASSAAVESFWRSKALASMFDRRLETARLWGRKLLLSLRHDELPQMEDLSLARRESWGLRLALVGFAPVLVLAILGLGAGRGRLDREVATYSLVVVLSALAVCVVFFVNGRLRMPMWPGLLALAAVGVDSSVAAFRDRRWRPLVLPLVLALAVAWIPTRLNTHSSFVHARSAARYAALEALEGNRDRARQWLVVMDEIERAGGTRVETTYREKPDSRWLLKTEKAAAFFALRDDRRAYRELLAVTQARPEFLRAQRGLFDVCNRLLAQGATEPGIRAARDEARARLTRGVAAP